MVQLGDLGDALLGVAAHGGTTAQLMPAGGGDYDVLWAAWGDDTVSPRTVHLALVKRNGEAARPTWFIQHEGYAPTIMPMDGWTFGTRGVVLLQYQVGAASSLAEVYGVGGDSIPSLLTTLSGSVIEQVTLDGATIIKVYEGADLKAQPTCYGWAAEKKRLVKVSCGRASP